MKFGDWLAGKIRAARLTQKRLSEVDGLPSESAIGKWVRGETSPALDPAQTGALCRALDVSFEELEKAYREGNDV